MILQVIEFIVTLAGLAFLAISLYRQDRQIRKLYANAEAMNKHYSPTAATPEQAAAPAASTSLITTDSRSPLSKEQFLLTVSLYAEATARYETLTYHSRRDLLAMTDEQALALISVRTVYQRGNTLYGSSEIYTKYPDVTPVEFIEVYDRSYCASVKATVHAIQAATVGQYV